MLAAQYNPNDSSPDQAAWHVSLDNIVVEQPDGTVVLGVDEDKIQHQAAVEESDNRHDHPTFNAEQRAAEAAREAAGYRTNAFRTVHRVFLLLLVYDFGYFMFILCWDILSRPCHHQSHAENHFNHQDHSMHGHHHHRHHHGYTYGKVHWWLRASQLKLEDVLLAAIIDLVGFAGSLSSKPSIISLFLILKSFSVTLVTFQAGVSLFFCINVSLLAAALLLRYRQMHLRILERRARPFTPYNPLSTSNSPLSRLPPLPRIAQDIRRLFFGAHIGQTDGQTHGQTTSQVRSVPSNTGQHTSNTNNARPQYPYPMHDTGAFLNSPRSPRPHFTVPPFTQHPHSTFIRGPLPPPPRQGPSLELHRLTFSIPPQMPQNHIHHSPTAPPLSHPTPVILPTIQTRSHPPLPLTRLTPHPTHLAPQYPIWSLPLVGVSGRDLAVTLQGLAAAGAGAAEAAAAARQQQSLHAAVEDSVPAANRHAEVEPAAAAPVGMGSVTPLTFAAAASEAVAPAASVDGATAPVVDVAPAASVDGATVHGPHMDAVSGATGSPSPCGGESDAPTLETATSTATPTSARLVI